MANAWEDFYSTGNVDFKDLYSSDLQGGFGSDYANQYTAQMLGLGSIGSSDPTSSTMDILSASLDEVKVTPQPELRQNINNRAKSALAKHVQGQIKLLADLYAKTGDTSLVDNAQDAQKSVDQVVEQPIGSKLAEMALRELKQEGLTDTDKIAISRQAQLAMVGEYLSAVDIGPLDVAGTLIPLRTTAQFLKHGGLDEYKQKIAEFKSMMPEEQVQKFPSVLKDVWEMAGENPLMFQERVLPFIDREDISEIYNAFAFDTVDATAILPITKLASFIKSATSPIKFARNAGRSDVAGRMIADALGDNTGRAAEAAGTDRVAAAASAMPFGGEGAIPEITNGLSAYAQKKIADTINKTRKTLSKLIYDPNLFVARSPLTEAETVAAQQKYLEQFAGSARITESTPTGFTVEITVENPKYYQVDWSETPNRIAELQGDIQQYQARLSDLKTTYGDEAEGLEEFKYINKVLVPARKELSGLEKQLDKGLANSNPTNTVVKTVKYTRDDVGILDATEYSNASAAVNSAGTYIDQMMRGAVDDSTVIGFTQQQLRNHFENAAKVSLQDLWGWQKRRISSILMQGDADKVGRYSTASLMEGVVTKDGLVRLTSPKEIAAYHSIRDVLDTAYLFKNRQLRRELEFDNWRSVKLTIGDEPVVTFVKPAINSQGQEISQLPDDVKKLYDFNSNKVIEVGDANIINNRIKNQGWILMRTKYPVEVGDELIDHVLAKASNIKRLPDRVLAHRPGYIPRIYKNIFYVAESVGSKVVNGVRREGYREVKRYFDSKSEADEWAYLQQAKNETIVVRPGREWLEMHPEFKQDYEAAVFGGLYSGKRADQVIPFGLAGTEAEHIGAFEAMEKAMSHVATRLPMNEFRMGMIRRFTNSARDPLTGKSLLSNPADWRSEIDLPKTSKQYIGLTEMRKWMEDQFRIPTAEERAWGNLTARLAQAIDGRWTRGSKKMFGKEMNPRLWLLNVGNKDIYASMRGLAFHALLGWFNPAQLYVQALGASMAFSVAPAKFTYLFPRYLALRAAMLSDNPEVWARTGLAAGLRRDDAIELVRAFRKSGILDSVKSSADFDAAIRGYGLSRFSFRRAADKGLIFFREGESFVRGYSWLMAHSEIMGKRVGKAVTDKEIDQITKRSLVYSMNLNRANRAHWQKGVLSIPTQFLQITSKFMENMAYSIKGVGKWTPWEKAKIMTGQVALFGAAGIPFGDWAVNGISEWIGSDDDYGLGVKSPEAITAIRGGLAEFLLYDWTGEQVAISQRVSIPSGIESFLEMLLRSDATLADKIAGAFGEVPGRTVEAFKDLAPVFVGYTEDMENWDTQEFLADVAVEIGDITSSWRNMHKALLWEQSKAILDNKGNPLIPLDPELDHNLILLKAWGLEPRAIEEYYNIVNYNKINKQDIQDVADAWIRVARKYANSEQIGTPKGQRRVANMISWLQRGLTEEQRADVAEKVMNSLKKDDYKITKELLEAIKNVEKTHGETTRGYRGSLEMNTLMMPQTPQASGEDNAE